MTVRPRSTPEKQRRSPLSARVRKISSVDASHPDRSQGMLIVQDTGAASPNATDAAQRNGRGLFEFAHHGLLVIRQADLFDQLELRFEPVDVLLGIGENFLKDVAADVVAPGLATTHRGFQSP